MDVKKIGAKINIEFDEIDINMDKEKARELRDKLNVVLEI